MQYSPVKECALSYGIPVLQPLKIKEKDAVEELRKYPADIFVVAAFGQLLSEEILNMPRLGCINIHINNLHPNLSLHYCSGLSVLISSPSTFST